jgi:hypothetical protein
MLQIGKMYKVPWYVEADEYIAGRLIERIKLKDGDLVVVVSMEEYRMGGEIRWDTKLLTGDGRLVYVSISQPGSAYWKKAHE